MPDIYTLEPKSTLVLNNDGDSIVKNLDARTGFYVNASTFLNPKEEVLVSGEFTLRNPGWLYIYVSVEQKV